LSERRVTRNDEREQDDKLFHDCGELNTARQAMRVFLV
jgi:hypothetical protein